MEAVATLIEDYPGLGLLAITSPDRLYNDWHAACADRAKGIRRAAHIESLLSLVPADAGLVTLIDGHPLTLSWIGAVARHPVHALGVTRFGESGDLPDLYAKHGIDAASVIAAAHQAARWRRTPRS